MFKLVLDYFDFVYFYQFWPPIRNLILVFPNSILNSKCQNFNITITYSSENGQFCVKRPKIWSKNEIVNDHICPVLFNFVQISIEQFWFGSFPPMCSSNSKIFEFFQIQMQIQNFKMSISWCFIPQWMINYWKNDNTMNQVWIVNEKNLQYCSILFYLASNNFDFVHFHQCVAPIKKSSSFSKFSFEFKTAKFQYRIQNGKISISQLLISQRMVSSLKMCQKYEARMKLWWNDAER